jgi:putative phosphoribosyl transferase
VSGRTVVIVDAGLATGATARAAVAVVRARGAARVVVAVPVGAPDSLRDLARVADEVIALASPSGFTAVGAWYQDFRQVGDDEVERLLS